MRAFFWLVFCHSEHFIEMEESHLDFSATPRNDRSLKPPLAQKYAGAGRNL